MEAENKESIHYLYDTILKNRHFEKLSEVISADYISPSGTKGIDSFQKSILELLKAFPDAQWKIIDIIAEGDKVIVKQNFTGTQKNQFQDIQPSYKTVSVDGVATYEIINSKIVKSQVQTDRLGFLQQLGVVPIDLSNTLDKAKETNAVYFIDKFLIPKKSIDAFVKQMNYNKEFVKNLSGYKGGQVFEQYDNEANLVIITIAVWENQYKLNAAKIAVQEEFKRIGFNPAEFYQRLDIKMERGQYNIIND